MQLFYNPNLTPNDKQVIFSKEESRHIIRVLRKNENDRLYITNGDNYLFTSEIIIASDKKCVAKIVSTKLKNKHWNYYLHIAIAPTKSNDRLEWFLEKATEIGIDEITPIICNNSERKVVKHERLEKIILSAMKQSLKFKLPKLNPAMKFKDFIETTEQDSTFIAHCEKENKISLKSVDKRDKYTILIGPEGDFSTDEIKLANEKNIKAISLGRARLRTETAAIVATQSISFTHEE